MKLFQRIIITFLVSLFAVWLSDRLIPGFSAVKTLQGLLTVAALLTVINVFFRPFIKLVLAPFIIITLGLFNLVINAGVLYALDFLSEDLTISGLEPLAYATLIITAANIAVNYSVKKQNQQNV